MNSCSEHGTNSNVCGSVGCFAAPRDRGVDWHNMTPPGVTLTDDKRFKVIRVDAYTYHVLDTGDQDRHVGGAYRTHLRAHWNTYVYNLIPGTSNTRMVFTGRVEAEPLAADVRDRMVVAMLYHQHNRG